MGGRRLAVVFVLTGAALALGWREACRTTGGASSSSRGTALRRVEEAAEAVRLGGREAAGAASVGSDEDGKPAQVVVIGRVVDMDGRPIPEAGVWGPRSSRHCWDSYAWSAVTGADGRFEVRRGPYVPRGIVLSSVLCTRVSAPGFVPGSVPGSDADRDALRKGGFVDVGTIVLRRSADVEGVVLETDGRVAPWAEVEWWVGGSDTRAPGARRRTHADGDGRYRIAGLDPQVDWRLAATQRDASTCEAVLGALLRGGATCRLDLVLTELPADGARGEGTWGLAGTVVDEAGRPVADASVGGQHFHRAPGQGYRVTTAADGRFAGVVSGWVAENGLPIEFDVEHEDFALRVVRLTDAHVVRFQREGSIDDLVVILRPPAVVRGRVVDPAGDPVAGATVRVVEAADGDRNPPWLLRTTTGGDGRFVLTQLEADASWWLIADMGLEASLYVPLGGRLRREATVTVDVPFPAWNPPRDVPLEILVRGWRAGMSISLDCMGYRTESPTWSHEVRVGPHRLWLYDAAHHVVGDVTFDVPYDAEAWRLAVDAEPCDRCAGDE